MRILLTGNSFHGYDSDVRDALTELGHQVTAVFNNIHGPFNTTADFSKKLAYGILPAKAKINWFVNQSVRSYNQTILNLIRKQAFDLVIVIGAKTLTEETLSQISIPKVLWFMDGILFYPQIRPKLNVFDHVFFFEPTDAKREAENLNNRCSTLHLGFNPKRFFPLNIPRKYDFSFVGSYYPNRDELLHSVINDSSKALIIGDFTRSEHESIRKRNTQRQISIGEVNRLYNESAININIHHRQSVEGLNVRTFEVQGSGNLQLVERQAAALEFFKDEHSILLYDSPEEFRDKLHFFLKHPEKQEIIRKNAYTDAQENHTWKHRMMTLFHELQQRSVL